MREAGYPPGRGRQDRRPQGNRPNTQQRPRATSAQNLGRLAAELDVDVLAVALGLSEQVTRSLIEGREQLKETQYGPHIFHRLADIGVPAAWLDTPNAEITPALLKSFREQGARSQRKAPTRRANFKKIVSAFDGRLQVLADALEMVETSIGNIVSGNLDLDDQRFGHINPRLMAAGFPDGWLDAADADLSPERVSALEALATDSYERSFEEEEYEREQRALRAQAKQQRELFAAAPQASEPELVATPPQQTAVMKEKNMNLKAPETSATATTKTSVPRGVAAAGRKLTLGGGGTALAGAPMPLPSPAGKTLHRPVKAAQPAPAAATTPPVPAAATPQAAVTAAPAPVAPAQVGRKRDDTTREQSERRSAALDQLLDTARRGAKVVLWRDLLGKGLAYWGNIRRGRIFFNDELAARTETALELPKGWLDNAKFPPASLAAWVTDADIPFPGEAAKPEAAKAEAPKAAAPSPEVTAAEPKAPARGQTVRPFARTTTAPTLTIEPQAPAPAPAVAAPAPAPAPVAAKPATAPAQEAAPAAAPVQAAAAAQAGKHVFVWQPAANPQPIVAPGPLTQALGTVLNRLSEQGTFTEDDALRMITFLLTPH